ncbi:MAG: CvpA family protein [Thermomicrobiales bacterium]
MSTTGDIAKNQATMNPQTIDLVVLGFIGIAALAGMWAGALRVAIGTACTGVVVALMLFGYGPLSSAAERLLHLPPRAAMIVAFGALALLGQGAVIAVIQKPLQPVLRLSRKLPPFNLLDRLFGLAAGAVVGSLVAGLLLAPVAISAPNLDIGASLREARLSASLLEVNARLLEAFKVRELLQPAADTLALPAPGATNETGRDLPFRVAADELVPDPEAEEQLLALVNEERVKVGLPPLEFDPALVPVGRAHATEMFDLGYFAHESPVTGTPFDRLAAAGIEYRAAGENLAFAPDVNTAHRGLMNSPGHRANILSPDFGRVGIAIMRSKYHGLMVVQMFRD